MRIKMSKKAFIVDEETGKIDEWVTEFYDCPACKEEYAIASHFNYCPECGVKIEFNKEGEK